MATCNGRDVSTGEFKEARTGPSLSLRLGMGSLIYPGVLHLYDVETEKSYTITTRQADSEIVLVEGGSVYYRINNRLYSAPILGTGTGDTGIGDPAAGDR